SLLISLRLSFFFFFQAEDGIRDFHVTGVQTCALPISSYRFDLTLEEDLIEEVARIYGFERLPDVPPMAPAKMFSQPEQRRGPHLLRRLAAAQDYQEVVNYSFVEADWERDSAANDNPVRLLNPIASHLSVMRSSLIAGLVA